jgi:hypothetical protein
MYIFVFFYQPDAVELVFIILHTFVFIDSILGRYCLLWPLRGIAMVRRSWITKERTFYVATS